MCCMVFSLISYWKDKKRETCVSVWMIDVWISLWWSIVFGKLYLARLISLFMQIVPASSEQEKRFISEITAPTDNKGSVWSNPCWKENKSQDLSLCCYVFKMLENNEDRLWSCHHAVVLNYFYVSASWRPGVEELWFVALCAQDGFIKELLSRLITHKWTLN